MCYKTFFSFFGPFLVKNSPLLAPMDGGLGMPKGVKVKNRAPAPIQITAEQILVESRERAEAAAPPAPRRHISDPAELADHRMRVRRDYEDRLRRLNKSIGTWLRYAKWEDGQGEVGDVCELREYAGQGPLTEVDCDPVTEVRGGPAVESFPGVGRHPLDEFPGPLP